MRLILVDQPPLASVDVETIEAEILSIAKGAPQPSMNARVQVLAIACVPLSEGGRVERSRRRRRTTPAAPPLLHLPAHSNSRQPADNVGMNAETMADDRPHARVHERKQTVHAPRSSTHGPLAATVGSDVKKICTSLKGLLALPAGRFLTNTWTSTDSENSGPWLYFE